MGAQVYKTTNNVIGRQVMGELYECDRDILVDEEKLKEIVIEATNVGNMKLLDVKSYKIGLGVSVIAIILESHITIHTWPEYLFATVDVYSCGPHTNPKAAFLYIVEKLKAKRYTIKEEDRSSRF